jgi:hypothetical protein
MTFARIVAAAAFAAVLQTVVIGADVIDFSRDVRPILADNCFVWHGPDDLQSVTFAEGRGG